MLSRLDVEDLQGNTLSLPLRPTTPGYLITEIDGLDPVKSDVVSASFAQLDGEEYQAARRTKRNITMRIRLEPYFGGKTVEELRAQLYAYFMPKTWCNLKFYIDGDLKYTIKGMTETCETALFSQDPEMAISILCFDPDFLGIDDVVISSNTVANSTETFITALGSVESGYIFQLNVNRSISGFTLYNRRPDNSLSIMTVNQTLDNGDVVKISTIDKDKYARLIRGGVTSSILYAVDQYSKWSPLYPGSNYFRALVSGAGIPYTITYRPKYGGL